MENNLTKLVRVFDVMKTVTEQVPERAYDVRAKGRLDNQLRAIVAIPAVDAVPVVRCRECLYWHDRGEDSYCSNLCIDTDADFYCANASRKRHGKRRKDGGRDERA